jgi:hypothetical protein
LVVGSGMFAIAGSSITISSLLLAG